MSEISASTIYDIECISDERMSVTTSPTLESMPHIQCEVESHLSDSTICEFECTYFEGVSEPPHRESGIVDRSCEATFNTNDLTSTSIVSYHLVLGPMIEAKVSRCFDEMVAIIFRGSRP